MDGLSVGYEDMTIQQLRDEAAAMLAEVERREAEDTARAAVVEAVHAYADFRGITVLQAWRALVPEGVDVPDDPEPEPIPDAPEYKQPTGAHDAYQAGDRVTFQGRVYEAVINAVVWSPLAYPQAWKEVR